MPMKYDEMPARYQLRRTLRDSDAVPAIRSREEIAESILRRGRSASLYTHEELARIQAADATMVRDLRQLMLDVLDITSGVRR